jgi:competence protein ComEA
MPQVPVVDPDQAINHWRKEGRRGSIWGPGIFNKTRKEEKMQKVITSLLVLFCLSLTTPFSVGANEKIAATVAVHQININTAAAKELQMLPGIGKVTADQIVQYRTDFGQFSSADDLLKVKGVGRKTLEKIRGMVIVK